MQQDTAARPQPDTKVHGSYEITAQITVDGGYSINVMTATGGTRIPELCIGTPNRDAYRRIYAILREGGINRVSPDGARLAVRDALTRELNMLRNRRDRIAQTLAVEYQRLVDAFTSAGEHAEMDALAADINRNLGRTLTDTVPAGRKSDMPMSRTGVEYKAPSDPQVRIMSNHVGGVVYAGNGVRWTSLRSLVRKGLTAEVHYQPGSKRISCVVLNKQGLAHTKASTR